MGNIQTLPLMPLRNIVVFPGTSVSFDAIRTKSIRALEEALRGNKEIFLVTQEKAEKDKPSFIDLYKVGTVAKINQVMHIQNGVVRVMVDGLYRARLCEIVSENEYRLAAAERIEENETDNLIVNEGFIRSLQKIFDEYFAAGKGFPQRNFIETDGSTNPGRFADAVASNVNVSYKLKQEILEEADVYVRIEKLVGIISKEIQILKISREVDAKVKRNIDENQREYYLREELKVIEEELGEKDGAAGEAAAYRETLGKLHIPKEHKQKLEKDIERFERMHSSSPDSAVLRNYLDTVLSLPWNRQSREKIDIKKAEEILDADHYGMEKVKERILEYLAVRSLTGGKDGTVLCLAGSPGTGKTSVAKSIARALGRKYVRISLGGIHDEADIRGHRKTYIGAMPGRIISAVAEAKVKNPLILLDEIDKMGGDYKGDPSSALLEVLDTEQNFSFRDHYVEIPFDLSGVMFVTTANNLASIPEPLLDRVEVIEVSGYTASEKECIAKRYLLPKQLEKNGLDKRRVTVSDSAVRDLIDYYTRESGVRGLEREIGSLMRKSARKMAEEGGRSVKITSKNLAGYMGRRKYLYDKVNDRDEVGTVRGLAWTSAGGDTLSVEVNVMPGSGKTELTGNLGDVMKESAMAAVSYIRSKSKELGIYERFYKTCDIHVHVPEGAVPKDGPSAGITMAAAMVSALTGYPIRRDTAMTGEITLRGKVLPIGGLKEKSAAAHRAGIKTVIIPAANETDLDDVSPEVKESIRFIPVSDMDEVLENVLIKKKRRGFKLPEEE